MAMISTALSGFGFVLLVHAAYSSYEHSLLTTANSSKLKSPSQSITALPTDIVVETLISTVLLVLGIILASPKLRPIEWAAWANEAEQDIRRPKGKKRFEGDGGAEGTNVSWLDDRRGFWDVRGKRQEFADWVRNGGGQDLKEQQ